jgi:hypothetical protein
MQEELIHHTIQKPVRQSHVLPPPKSAHLGDNMPDTELALSETSWGAPNENGTASSPQRDGTTRQGLAQTKRAQPPASD